MAHNFARKLFQIHDTFHVQTIAAPRIQRKQFNGTSVCSLSVDDSATRTWEPFWFARATGYF